MVADAMKGSSRNGGIFARAQSRATLSLLGAFELTCDGEPVSLPVPAQAVYDKIAGASG